MARLQPGAHVREAMLERLVGGQRTTEGEPVGGPPGGHLEHAVQAAADLGALQHHGDLRLPLDDRVRADRPHQVPRTDRHVIEAHLAERAGQVQAPLRTHRDPARVRRDEELRGAVVGGRGDQEHVGLARELDTVLDAVEPVAALDGGGGQSRPQRLPRPPRLVDGPGRHGLAADQRLYRRGVVTAAGLGLHQPGQHDVGRQQRSGGDALPEGLGDQCQIPHPLTRHTAAPELLGHPQRRPAQLRRTGPPVAEAPLAHGLQLADPCERELLVHEVLRRRSEELLIR